MLKNYMLRNGLVFGIIILFIGAGVVPSINGIGSVSTVIYSPIITIDGTMGENDWYISCVTITFSVIDPEIDYIMYKIDDGEWITFTGPFVICEDGEHTICWYYVDNEGNQSCPEYVDFKIDQKSPTIELAAEKIGFMKWLITADVYDATSGVERVEFYICNDVNKLMFTDYEAPYEWIYNVWDSSAVSTQSMIPTGHPLCGYYYPLGIAYDYAGNYACSELPTFYPSNTFSHMHVSVFNSKQLIREDNDADLLYCTTLFSDGSLHDVGVKKLLWPFDEENATIDGGIYPVEAIVKNYGTLNEGNFTVNATIWSIVEGYDDEIYYQDTFVVSLTLHPGDEVTIIFEDVAFYCPNSFFPGNYRIEITTELDQDENPINDMKTVFFSIRCYVPPPETYHTFYPAVPNGNNEWYICNVTIELTAEGWCGVEVDYTCFCIDHGDWQIYNEPIVVFDDGEHTLAYYSVDILGNMELPKGPFDFKIDQTPPITTIDFGEPYYEDLEGNIYVTSDTPIYLNATDDESGVNATYYKINDGNWVKYIAPFSIPEDCNHAIYFYSDDNAGNVESIRNKNVSVDNYPPFPVIPLPDGENGWYNSSVIITFTDEKSGICYIMYRIDNGPWEIYCDPILITGDGWHTFGYYAVDNVGNEGTGSFSFKIDQTDPVTTCLLNGTVGENGWYVSDVTVTLNAEDETSGVDYTMYKLDDDVEWQTYIESFIVTEDGEHVLYYCSVDIAGNTETTNEVAFKIDHDVLPPVTTHELDGIMGDNDWYTSNVVVTLTAEDDSAGVACTRYKVDDDIWRNYTTSFIVTEDGMHNLSYYSVDKVGNKEDDKGPFGFKIDQIAPTINLTVEKIGFRKWLLTATVSDETSGVAGVEFYYADELLGEVTEAPYEWLYSGSYGENATAIVYDNAGNSAQDEKPVSHSYSQSRSSNPQTPLFFQILGRLLNTR